MWTAMHADCTACGLHSCRGCIIQGCTALQVHKHMSSGGNTLLLHPCCRLLLFPLFFFLFCFVTQGPICFMGKGAKITAGFSRIRKKLFPFALLEKCAAEKPIFTMSKRWSTNGRGFGLILDRWWRWKFYPGGSAWQEECIQRFCHDFLRSYGQ